MEITRRSLMTASAGATPLPVVPRQSHAQVANTIRTGVPNDQSGPYRDISGPYGTACTQRAVQEFGCCAFDAGAISTDRQNTPDVGANLARQWYDRDGADTILNLPTSSVVLVVSQVTQEKNTACIDRGAATSDRTGPQSTPNAIFWMRGTSMLARSIGAMRKANGDNRFFITADDVFGRGRIRENGRKLCPAHLFEVKRPEESKAPSDYDKLLPTMPVGEAFRPTGEGHCPLVQS